MVTETNHDGTFASRMTRPRILIAGIGNIFLGDDAFGVEVAQRLLARKQRDDVRIVDFGIRGIDLTYALLDGCEVAILVDAVPRGQAPGTVYVIEPDITGVGRALPADPYDGMPFIEGHNLDPERVLRIVASLGGKVGRVLLVGCEPTPIDPEQDFQMGLSPPVQTAVDEAIRLIESLIVKILNEETHFVGSALDASEAHLAG